MKARLCTIILAGAFAFSPLAHAKAPLQGLYGTWKIQSIIGGGAVSSMSDQEARQLIGKTLIVEARRFVFNGQACAELSYEETTEGRAGHFDREWRTDVKDLLLPDPVTVIDTGCNTLYPLKNGKLMVTEKGVFFEAVRVKRSPRP
jgi:hypothetical protein